MLLLLIQPTMRYMALYALILKINPFIFIFLFKYDVSAMQMLDMMFINTTFQLYLIILGGHFASVSLTGYFI